MNLDQSMDRLTVVVADPIRAMLVKISGYVPLIIGALVILILGYIIAKFIEALIVRILRAIRVDIAADKAGLTKMLQQGDIRQTLSEIIGVIVYWIVVLLAIVAALNALNLTIAADLLAQLVEYIPSIIAALFVLVLGMFLASFVGAIVKTAAANAGIANAKTLGQLVQIVLLIFATLIAVQQLKIDVQLLGFTINIIVASIGLGCAIAFGLGSKDIAGRAISDFLNKMKR